MPLYKDNSTSEMDKRGKPQPLEMVEVSGDGSGTVGTSMLRGHDGETERKVGTNRCCLYLLWLVLLGLIAAFVVFRFIIEPETPPAAPARRLTKDDIRVILKEEDVTIGGGSGTKKKPETKVVTNKQPTTTPTTTPHPVVKILVPPKPRPVPPSIVVPFQYGVTKECDVWCGGDILMAVTTKVPEFAASKLFVDRPLHVSMEYMTEKWTALMKATKDLTLTKVDADHPGIPTVLSTFVKQCFGGVSDDFVGAAPAGWVEKPHRLLRRVTDKNFNNFAADLNSLWQNKFMSVSDAVMTTPAYTSMIPLRLRFASNGGIGTGAGGALRYLDSYYTVQGMLASGLRVEARNTVVNLLSLINEFGYMPQSNRRYALDRSAPPTAAVSVLNLANSYRGRYRSSRRSRAFVMRALEALEKEYTWWMTHRVSRLTSTTVDPVTKVAKQHVLNRYEGTLSFPGPRAENVALDRRVVEGDAKGLDGAGEPTSERTAAQKASMYQQILAASESGYDFSERFQNRDSRLGFPDLLHTSNVVPVCLNSHMLKFELAMVDLHRQVGNTANSAQYKKAAYARAQSMQELMYDEANLQWRDYLIDKKSQGEIDHAVNWLPLWAGIHDILAVMGGSADTTLETKPAAFTPSTYGAKMEWAKMVHAFRTGELIGVGGVATSPQLVAKSSKTDEEGDVVRSWVYPAVSPALNLQLIHGFRALGKSKYAHDDRTGFRPAVDLAEGLASTLVHTMERSWSKKRQVFQVYDGKVVGGASSMHTIADDELAKTVAGPFVPAENDADIVAMSVALTLLYRYGRDLELQPQTDCQIWCDSQVLDVVVRAEAAVSFPTEQSFLNMPLTMPTLKQMLSHVPADGSEFAKREEQAETAKRLSSRNTDNTQLVVDAFKTDVFQLEKTLDNAATDAAAKQAAVAAFVDKYFDKNVRRLSASHFWYADSLADRFKTYGRQSLPVTLAHPAISNIIPLPMPYIVSRPSDDHFLYQGAYAQMRGLLAMMTGRVVVPNMGSGPQLSRSSPEPRYLVENLLSLVERFGFVPHGSALHFARRSSAPMLASVFDAFCKQTRMISPNTDLTALRARALPLIHKEYSWWMLHRTVDVVLPTYQAKPADDDGGAATPADGDAAKPAPETEQMTTPVVTVRMNRYAASDESSILQASAPLGPTSKSQPVGIFAATADGPRPEHYKADALFAVDAVTAGDISDAETAYDEVNAASESGWGRSSRWLRDNKTPTKLHVANLVPVCLNTIMFRTEQILASMYEEIGDTSSAGELSAAAHKRAYNMAQLMYDPKTAQWRDYIVNNDVKQEIYGRVDVLSNWAPLWAGLTSYVDTDDIEAEEAKIIAALAASPVLSLDEDTTATPFGKRVLMKPVAPPVVPDDSVAHGELMLMITEGLFAATSPTGPALARKIVTADVDGRTMLDPATDLPTGDDAIPSERIFAGIAMMGAASEWDAMTSAVSGKEKPVPAAGPARR